jgi:hypothetical protein
MLPHLHQIYEDPADPNFRLYEVDARSQAQVAGVKRPNDG